MKKTISISLILLISISLISCTNESTVSYKCDSKDDEIVLKDKDETSKTDDKKTSNKENTKDTKLEKAWKTQKFLDTDIKGRNLYESEPNFCEEAEGLSFPIKYQFYYSDDIALGASIKICFKTIGKDTILDSQKEEVWNLILNFNKRNPNNKLKSVYFYNLDNTANERYHFNYTNNCYIQN
ncbi:hypothetical protein [Clostridium chrysemydis]|uniref:hypothetical protein n=1 Tax=Clostridium chrysemydis TaxID=2665504 RepID=UPI0018844F0C|nr:hypothetical protein [Clostridium chrysemydis]